MSATRLLVLAFVRAHRRAHGYLVGQELMAWNADKWANTKTGSIYHALRQLAKEGHLVELSVQEGSDSPARTEYEITRQGDAEFHALMERALTVPDPRPDMFCAGLVLMSALPRAQVLDFLESRRLTLQEQRENVRRANEVTTAASGQSLPAHVDVLLNFWTDQTDCGYDWVQWLISRIEAGDYVFADDDKNVFGTPGSRVGINPVV